jgi:hypothetical protein
MKKMSDASKNIYRVYHLRIIAPKRNQSAKEPDPVYMYEWPPFD